MTFITCITIEFSFIL
ncbi:hypothetical protein ECEC4402_1347, partial [Escherichia coli EC4402]